MQNCLEQLDISGSTVLADKAYGSWENREYIANHDADFCIPPKSNSADPWYTDFYHYKERHLADDFGINGTYFDNGPNLLGIAVDSGNYIRSGGASGYNGEQNRVPARECGTFVVFNRTIGNKFGVCGKISARALLFETIRWNFMNGGDRYGIIPVLRMHRVREHACSSYA